MKPTAIIINMGRGGIVNEADLASLGDLVEVVEKPATQPAPVKEEKPAEAEKETEPEQTQEKPKPAARRKKTSESK